MFVNSISLLYLIAKEAKMGFGYISSGDIYEIYENSHKTFDVICGEFSLFGEVILCKWSLQGGLC